MIWSTPDPSPAGKETPVAETTIEHLATARARKLRRSVGDQLLEMREDRELSQREVAAAVDMDRSWLARAEVGEANVTLDALAALATALGMEPSLRLYPAAGARLQDHLQAGVLEALLEPSTPAGGPGWRSRCTGRPAASSTSCSRRHGLGGRRRRGAQRNPQRRAAAPLGGREGRFAPFGRRLAVDGPRSGRRAAPAPALDGGHARRGEGRPGPVRRGIPGPDGGCRGGPDGVQRHVSRRGDRLGGPAWHGQPAAPGPAARDRRRPPRTVGAGPQDRPRDPAAAPDRSRR